MTKSGGVLWLAITPIFALVLIHHALVMENAANVLHITEEAEKFLVASFQNQVKRLMTGL